MAKPVSTSNKPRKPHTPEFGDEALKLAERIAVTAATLIYRLVDVITNDSAACLWCMANGTVALKAHVRRDYSYRPW